MKIKDVVLESVDISFWKKLDAIYNPEALSQIKQQETRYKTPPGQTAIVTAAPKQTEPKFNSRPSKGEPPSAGFRGNVDVQVRSKHISKDEGTKLINSK